VHAHVSGFTAPMDGKISKGNHKHFSKILHRPRHFTDRPTKLVTIRHLGDKIPFSRHVLNDTVRLQLPAALLRKNISGSEVGIGDEILPNGAIAVCFPINLF
jgi:hypothetical protein